MMHNTVASTAYGPILMAWSIALAVLLQVSPPHLVQQQVFSGKLQEYKLYVKKRMLQGSGCHI
jgi:hypothetical protein